MATGAECMGEGRGVPPPDKSSPSEARHFEYPPGLEGHPLPTPARLALHEAHAHGYWLEEAPAVELLPELVGERSADVVVVGGGYTGMWAAWHVKELEPEARVVLLEAGRCGQGPSGRNGGFCNVMWFSLPNMRRRWGDEAALAVARAAAEAVDGDRVRSARARESTPGSGAAATCRSRPRRRTTGSGRGAGRLSGARWRGRGPAALARTQVAERCASPAFRGGAFYPDAATVQPARLAHRPARAAACARGRDPRALAGTPAARRRRMGSRRTPPRGVVRAAHGGARRRRRGEGAGAGRCATRLTVASSHIVLTEPVPELLEEIGWTGGECITDSRALIDYFRTTPDGRIAFGWGGGRIAMGARLRGRAELDAEVVAAAAAHLLGLLPRPRGPRAHPRLGRPDRRLADPPPPRRSPCAAAAPSPPPATPATASAPPTWSAAPSPPSPSTAATSTPACLRRPAPPQRVPPEPFHWLGGEAIRRAIMQQGGGRASRPAPRTRSAPWSPASRS